MKLMKRKTTSKVAGASATFDKGFLNSLIESTDNELASIMDEEGLSNTTEWIKTNSLALNGLISADIFKGIPNNKVIAFAGEEATGKTFLCLDIAKCAIEAGYIVAFFDSENATDKQMIVDRGIDPRKIAYFPVDTVENFRKQVINLVNKYNDTPEGKRPKILIILDSLGNLSTTKEMTDAETGSGKRDMTRAQVIKSVFRTVNLKLAKAKIPMLITNHTYDSVGDFMPTKEMSGGSGLKYAAHVVIFLSRSKAKDNDKKVKGVYLNCRLWKSRLCRLDSRLKIYLDFSKGLSKYFGLQEFGWEEARGGWKIGNQFISENNLMEDKIELTEAQLNDTNKILNSRLAFGETKVESTEETN